MNLTQIALRRPITTMMVFTCLVVVGMIAAGLLPLEFFPEVEYPHISVRIPYPGATPEEVERQIIRPVEEVVATIAGIKRMDSDSYENGAWIHIEFKWGEDIKLKAMQIKEKIDGIRHQLPDDLERFYVRQYSYSDWEMLNLRISSNRDLSNSYDMLNRNLKRRLERINGVAQIDLYGVEKKEIRIQLLADRITAHHVDLNRLSQILRRSNFSVTAGRITDANRRFAVRPIGEFQSIDEIGELIVGDHNLRLQDIANITYDHPRLDYGRHLDRNYAIGLDVYKEAGANIVEVTNLVNAEIEKRCFVNRMYG
jgi:HAE1 family hydrophobic/amphiphilic exporter-1